MHGGKKAYVEISVDKVSIVGSANLTPLFRSSLLQAMAQFIHTREKPLCIPPRMQ